MNQPLLLPPDYRCTAYWWAQQRGLPTDLSYLLEFGLRAARIARWYGVPEARTREGPYWVHQWEPWTWAAAEADMAAMYSAAPLPDPARSPDYPARAAVAAAYWLDGQPPPPTRVVNLHAEPYDVNIMRPGPWGNPFVIGRDGSRIEVIAKYSVWVRGQPALMAALGELHGRVLGCCCKPEPCHGDVLAALADGREPPAWVGGLRVSDRYVCAAPIAESPWPQHAGEPCDGHHPGIAAATWVVWTSVDTGDGFRLACEECLGGWVISVGSRLWLGPGRR